MKREVWENWSLFSAFIQVAVTSVPAILNIRKIDRPDAEDVDVKLRHYLSIAARGGRALQMLGGLATALILYQLPSAFLAALKAMPEIIETMWDLIIDPNVDAQ